MAATTPKAKGDVILGLTPTEAKLIILGVLVADEQPKVCVACLSSHFPS